MRFMELKKTRRILSQWLVRLFLIVCTVVFLYPFFWNVIASFKTNQEFMINQISLPKAIAWDNYARAFTKANMGAYFFNSLLVVSLSVAFLLVFIVPASYALTRYRFRGSKLIANVFMACIFIQPTVIMIPLYVQTYNLKMTDNLVALSLVYAVVLYFPFGIFLLSGFLRSVPRDYEEAARIDGCGNWRILLTIIVPLIKPGIATVTMLAAMGFWNEYPLAFVLIRDDARKTLPIGLAHLYQVARRATDWGALFAALVIVLIPTVIIYLLGQRYLLKGVGAGGLKG